MNIGIDIDGVLTNLEEYISIVGKDYAIKNKLEFDEKMGINSIYGFLSNDDNHRFWDTYWEDYAKNVKMRPFVSDVLSKLRKNGYKIIIITSRTYDNQILKAGRKRQKNMENLIVEWLHKNNIKYDKLVFSNLDKLSDCIENDIDIMIEDSISNIKKLKDYIRIIRLKQSTTNIMKTKIFAQLMIGTIFTTL